MQGLQNLGSTCAINSLIQMICRTQHLRDIILNTNNITENSITYQLKEILDMMHNKNHSLSPKKFIGHLYRHFDGIFRQGEQLDIGEVWMFLIDKISSECAEPSRISSFANKNYQITLLDNTNNSLVSSQELWDKYNYTINNINNQKTSNWLESSQGIMLNMLKCNICNTMNYNFEPFTMIPLDIPDDVDKPSIASMFRNYLKSQECQGDWKCEKCNECTPYIRMTKIWKMPPVITFVIKRFSNMHTKIIKPVYLNQKLSVKKGSIISHMHADIDYHCNAVALHFGGLSGGHYCALCKTNDNWIFYDDLNIARVEDTKIFFDGNKDIYMIMYSI
jgi:ubiquitin C-terminal hydrolase